MSAYVATTDQQSESVGSRLHVILKRRIMTRKKFSFALRYRAVAIAAFTACLATPALAEGPIKIDGTTVTITPPPGFERAKDFAGLANAAKGGSFLIAEFPAKAAGDLGALFGDEDRAKANFAKQGIIIAEQEEIESAAGQSIPILRGTQEANGVKLDKWMALYTGAKTVMITFQIPEEHALGEDVMKAAFASVSTGDAPAVKDEIAALPFRVEPTAPFRVVQSLAGSALLMKVGESDEDPERKDPMMIVTYSKSTTAGQPLAATAEATLKAIQSLQKITVTAKEETTFADADGVILHATAEQDGAKKRVMQFFTISADRVLQAIAIVPEADFEKLKEAIEETAGTAEFKD